MRGVSVAEEVFHLVDLSCHSEQVDPVLGLQRRIAAGHKESLVSNDGRHACVTGELHAIEGDSQHRRVLRELNLCELDLVVREHVDVEGAVGAGDVEHLVGDEDVGVHDHVDAEHAELQSFFDLIGLCILVLSRLKSRDGSTGAESLRCQRGDDVHLVVVGCADDEVGLLHPGQAERTRGWRRSP